jgi:hypothetical protein
MGLNQNNPQLCTYRPAIRKQKSLISIINMLNRRTIMIVGFFRDSSEDMFDMGGMDQSWNSSQWVDVERKADSDDDIIPQLDGTWDLPSSIQSNRLCTANYRQQKTAQDHAKTLTLDAGDIPQIDGVFDISQVPCQTNSNSSGSGMNTSHHECSCGQHSSKKTKSSTYREHRKSRSRKQCLSSRSRRSLPLSCCGVSEKEVLCWNQIPQLDGTHDDKGICNYFFSLKEVMKNVFKFNFVQLGV